MEELFLRLDSSLQEISKDFFKDSREFRSLVKVLEVLEGRVGVSAISNAVLDTSDLEEKLQKINQIIEEVVTFKHGSLNNSLDTMSEVLKEYSRGQEEVNALRNALKETQKVLTAKKLGQTSLRELWMRRVELQESLRMVKELEELKNLPGRVNRLMQQKRYFSSVNMLNKAISKIFGEDLSNVGGLTPILQQIMELKERLLTETIDALKDAVLETDVSVIANIAMDSDSDEETFSDSRSDSALSYLHGSTIYDEKSIYSSSKTNFEVGPSYADSNIDLQSFDESAETAAVMDSTGSNQLYMRMLVHTISLLQCEEDAERLLLDRFPQRFCDYYLRQLRSSVQQQVLSLTGGGEGDLAAQGRVLARFVSFLLDSVLEVMRRLALVTKLLTNSKTLRQGSQNSPHNTINSQLVFIWASMEDVVNYEIQIHLVESDLEKISDRAQTLSVALSLDEDFSTHSDHRLLLTPSSQHASLLFRKIVDYNTAAQALMKDSFAVDNTQSRPVLSSMQHFLETEFIPVIQSAVNQDIRVMMLDADASFSTQKGIADQRLPCMAAQKTSDSAEALMIHYKELFQHRDMIAVVLDRLIRGFISAGKDFRENMLFSWQFLLDLPMKRILQSVRNDSAFIAFKQAMFAGKASLEEFLGVPGGERQQTIEENAENYLMNGFISEFNTIWNEKYWEISNPNYLFEQDLGKKRDVSIIASIASLSFSFAWLLKKIVGSIRRSSQNLTFGAGKSTKPIGKREDFLKQTMLSPLSELMQFIDESFVYMRIFCQAECFVFVHKLARQLLGNDVGAKPSRKELAREDFLSSEESEITGFVQQLSVIGDAIVSEYSRAALSIVFGSIVVLVPRLLLHLLMRSTKHFENQIIKTKLLRLIVTIQQNMSVFFNNMFGNELEVKRQLLDIMTDEFERVRKVLSDTNAN